ncbi:MAG: hypothetical protein HND48_02220 [Chloroflexi bacterium]|nr:hypothetical protein [Chloroflexota bacterium]
MVDAERLGEDALQIAHDERERAAASKLHSLSKLAREWVERGGAASASRSKQALDLLVNEYEPDQAKLKQDFDAQMPSREAYLKSMSRGLVEIFARHSTASTRVLAFDYLLNATIQAHEGQFASYEFYREAAMRASGKPARAIR